MRIVFRRALLGAALVAALDPSSVRAQSVTPAVRAWRQQHEAEVVKELADLVAIPNVARDHANIVKNAEAVRALMERRGIKAQILDNGDAPPAVYGELRTPGATRTVGMYAHYDGQPVNPPDWTTPPFQPTLRAPPNENVGGSAKLMPSSPPVNHLLVSARK